MCLIYSLYNKTKNTHTHTHIHNSFINYKLMLAFMYLRDFFLLLKIKNVKFQFFFFPSKMNFIIVLYIQYI